MSSKGGSISKPMLANTETKMDDVMTELADLLDDGTRYAVTAYSSDRGFSMRLEASRISSPTMFPSLS
jgi:hypothetical protein